jgi:tripartite-type tricarboxylate transporter receptor subunit TctC
VVPKATPAAVIEKISAEVRKVLSDPAMQKRIVDRGAVPDPRGPAEWTEFVNAEIVKWREIVLRANLKAE